MDFFKSIVFKHLASIDFTSWDSVSFDDLLRNTEVVTRHLASRSTPNPKGSIWCQRLRFSKSQADLPVKLIKLGGNETHETFLLSNHGPTTCTAPTTLSIIANCKVADAMLNQFPFREVIRFYTSSTTPSVSQCTLWYKTHMNVKYFAGNTKQK